MSARPESWSPPADPVRAALVCALGIALFFAAWGTLHFGFYNRSQIVDTPVYESYGDQMAAGRIPYKDFGVEYPPAALPVFLIPSLFAAEHDFEGYRRAFEGLMAFFGALAVGIVGFTLARSGASPGRLIGGIAFAALAPLAVGNVVLSRFDLWPALLTIAAIAALVAERDRLGHGVLGLAFAAKIYPGVLLPLALAYTWRRLGRRAARQSLLVFSGVVVACFLPFLILSPGGVWDSVVRQTSRPLQLESMGASILLVLHQAFGLSITMQSGHGSQNLAGGEATALATISTVVQVVVLVGIWLAFARGAPTKARLLAASAAAVTAFITLGKVLSPQYLIWLVPLVVLVPGRRGLKAAGLLALAMVLTQLWFPYRYWALALAFDGTASWLVFLRDLTLVTLLFLLVRGLRHSRT